MDNRKDDKVSDVCNANGGMGVIGLHEPFPRCVDDTRASKWQVRGCSRCRADRQAGERQPRDGNGRWTAGEVVSVSAANWEFAETKELRKAAMQYARDNFVGKSYVNESSGHELKVTWQGVKHAASKSNSIELSLWSRLIKF